MYLKPSLMIDNQLDIKVWATILGRKATILG